MHVEKGGKMFEVTYFYWYSVVVLIILSDYMNILNRLTNYNIQYTFYILWSEHLNKA